MWNIKIVLFVFLVENRYSPFLEHCFTCCFLVWLRIVTLLLGMTLGLGPTGRGVV
ncbi:unnamed protein product [Ectocarpus sp. 12 AP-2014]